MTQQQNPENYNNEEDLKKYLEMYNKVVAAFTEYHNKHLKLLRSCTKGSIMEVTHALTKLSRGASDIKHFNTFWKRRVALETHKKRNYKRTKDGRFIKKNSGTV